MDGRARERVKAKTYPRPTPSPIPVRGSGINGGIRGWPDDSDSDEVQPTKESHDDDKSVKILAAIDGSRRQVPYDDEGKPVGLAFGRRIVSLMDIFLPVGYPHSVTPDYTPYQIYDSLQAFSSTIAGLLSSRAVLQGFGVGDSTSSATAAVLLTVLQESTGRLATILFAHRYGQAIQPECKFYRFLADIVNDGALFLDILAPALPSFTKVMALCGAGVLRALCGVSGGAAKAELSAHFARNGNLAELNAKDGSQETVISLLGMLVGSLFLHFVHNKLDVLTWMIVLVTTHLWTNYQAVRSVEMRTLNKQRLCILLQELLDNEVILRPNEVAASEKIMTWVGPNISFANTLPQPGEIPVSDLQKSKGVGYVIVSRNGHTKIWMKVDMPSWSGTPMVVQAWAEAYCAQRWTHERSPWKRLEAVGWDLQRLVDAGWDLETNALETSSSTRLIVTG
ncbi:DUF647-domain-containing protein [Hypoxylon sp. NC0597]|nr:DUF647-domain-containing protein [Hypoxylon sp. NC0597]